MLTTFIKFTPTNDFCELPCGNDEVVLCRDNFYESNIIAKKSDTISFIISKSEYNLFIDKVNLFVALSRCGEFVAVSEFTILESVSQYYITCILPSYLTNDSYQLILFVKYKLVVYSFIPETSPGACDAIVNLAVENPPAVSFVYSKDGINWFDSSTFTGLCMQPYNFYVKENNDDDCTLESIIFNATPVDCGDFAGDYLQQLNDYFLTQLANCELFDMI